MLWPMHPHLQKKILANQLSTFMGPFFRPLHVPWLMLTGLKAWRFFPAWLWSFRQSYSLLDEGTPLLPFEATNWLRTHVTRSMTVFEYGSGGSTIFLAGLAGQVYTVEHDENWYFRVSTALARRGITNCSYEVRPPSKVATTSSALDSSQRSSFMFDEREWEYPGMTFDAYVKTIDAHPDQSLDLVLVDGRARAACLARAIRKIRKTGFLMLDNSNDEGIVDSLGNLEPYPRIDMHGIAPGWPPARWTTSVWQMAGRTSSIASSAQSG